MKKIKLLAICSIALFMSCKKDQTTNNPPASPAKNLVSVIGGGSGSSIGYNPSTGKYEATYYGANLEFWPIPNNSNYKDGDIVDLNITCTNCNFLNQTGAGYFVGAIPILSPGALSDIHTKLEKFNDDVLDHLVGAKKTDGSNEFKVPVMPVFPESGGQWEQAFSGVVVRSHSSPSTIVIMPSTFVVNSPRTQYTVAGIYIGSYTDTANHKRYNFFHNLQTNVMTSVQVFDILTEMEIPDYQVSGEAFPNEAKVTAQVIKDGNVVLSLTKAVVY